MLIHFKRERHAANRQHLAFRQTWKCSCRRTRSWCSPGSFSRKKWFARWGQLPWGALPTRHKLLWAISAPKRQAEDPDSANSVPRGDPAWTESWPCLEERWALLWHGNVSMRDLGTQSLSQAALHSPRAPMDSWYRTSEKPWIPTYFSSVLPTQVFPYLTISSLTSTSLNMWI